MFKQKVYRFKNVIEVEEYHNGRYGAPGQARQKKRKATKEQMKKRNQFNKEKRARHRLREHFKKNDYFSCLTYKKEERPPDMGTAKQQFKKCMNKVRKEYRKRGHELKYLRNIEVGTKGGWHIHLVINRIPDTDIILKESWEYGKVVNQLLYEKGDFTELAGYITKTPDTDPRLKETDYRTSKNLPLPEPEEKVIKRGSLENEPRPRKGFYLDKESYHEGINPVTGYKYRYYTMIRINRRI